MPKPKDPGKQKYMFSDDIKFLQKAVVSHPSENKFLALKRSEDSFSRPNCWDLPGGNVQFGQLHIDSLEQEIKQESGLDFVEIKPIQVLTSFDKDIYYIFIGYMVKAVSDDVKISEEHSEYRWVTKEEFLKLESADYLKDMIRKALRSSI